MRKELSVRLKVFITLLVSIIFSILIINQDVRATSVEEDTTSIAQESVEDRIMKYDAITGKTTEVNMEELRNVISTLSVNSSDDPYSVSGYTPEHIINETRFESLIMPMMSDSKYEKTATRITNTVPVPYSKVLKVSFEGGRRVSIFSWT